MWNVRASDSFRLLDQGPFQFKGNQSDKWNREAQIWQTSDKRENYWRPKFEIIIDGPLRNPRLNFGKGQAGLCSWQEVGGRRTEVLTAFEGGCGAVQNLRYV